MTITRANVESILVQRCGRLMSFVGMAVTVAGSNASLNDPIGYAVRQIGYTVANITSVADIDLASIADAELDELLDYAELRTLESIAGNMDAVDITNGPESEKFSQVSTTVDKRLSKLTEKIAASYGTGLEISTSNIINDFAAHGDDSEINIQV
jgi:hypothetical protein